MTKNIKDKCKEICSTCINTKCKCKCKCKCKNCIDLYPYKSCGGACGLKLSVSAFKRCREAAEENKKK